MISPNPITIKEAKNMGFFNYVGAGGTFFTTHGAANTKRISASFNCRDECLHYVPANCRTFGFVSSNLDAKLVNMAWRSIERKLRIDDSEHSVIHRVRREFNGQTGFHVDPHTIIIKLNPFWVRTEVTRSFMTLFLRLSGRFYQGDFREAVEAYDLASMIPQAIDWFLAGNTEIKSTDWYNPKVDRPDFGGVIDLFSRRSLDEVKRMLVRPSGRAVKETEEVCEPALA